MINTSKELSAILQFSFLGQQKVTEIEAVTIPPKDETPGDQRYNVYNSTMHSAAVFFFGNVNKRIIRRTERPITSSTSLTVFPGSLQFMLDPTASNNIDCMVFI